MLPKPYHARRMNTAVSLPWKLLVDLELEAQRLGVSRSQLVAEYIAAGLGAPLPPPVQARHRPRGRKRRTRYIPTDLRETSAPWLGEPRRLAAEPFVDVTDNPRRALVRRPIVPETGAEVG